jgi:hypothetical protein
LVAGHPALAESFGLRGAQPGGDPGPIDRCLQRTDSVFKMIARFVSAHSASHVPTRYGSSRFTPIELASASRLVDFGAFSSQKPA